MAGPHLNFAFDLNQEPPDDDDVPVVDPLNGEEVRRARVEVLVHNPVDWDQVHEDAFQWEEGKRLFCHEDFSRSKPRERESTYPRVFAFKKKPRKIPDSVEVHVIDSDDDDRSKDYSVEDASKQLVVYNPEITHDKQSDIDHYTSPRQSSKKPRYGSGMVLPSIGAYTVQCASCYQWRIVPTKEKYEELRESISQKLFVCARASEWNRALSCDEPGDISQDGSRLWALDKPNIAQPPPGWDREVRLRGGASNKFADVYYTSPSGKKLRSLVEIGRYLANNPQYIREGVNLSQFSFAIPKPLQEDYAGKHTFLRDSHELPELPEIAEVDPLSWAAPPTRRELLTGPGSWASNPAGINQLEMSGSVNLHQSIVPEPPAQYRKKRPAKQVPSRKCSKIFPALPASSCPFEEQSGGHIDIDHVAL